MSSRLIRVVKSFEGANSARLTLKLPLYVSAVGSTQPAKRVERVVFFDRAVREAMRLSPTGEVRIERRA